MARQALILVDLEQEWIDKNSEYYVGDLGQIIEKVNKLIDFCREKGFKVIFTRHIEKDSESGFREGSTGIELIPGLHKEENDILITKYKVSSFFRTKLEKELYGVNQIVVAGILTNLCVRSAIEDAYDRDFEIIVIKDCCVAFDEETQSFTIKDLKETREEIEFLNLDEFVKI